MSHGVTVRHNFEPGHRLPHLPGKCVSLHGHSWWTEVTVEAPDLPLGGMVVESGPFKQQLRRWIDEHLDHGLMLGPDDELLPLLSKYGKVHPVPGWPARENVAALITGVAEDKLRGLVRATGAHVARVHVADTHVNVATWTAA